MVLHTEAICRQMLSCFSLFDHFVGLVLKGLKVVQMQIMANRQRLNIP